MVEASQPAVTRLLDVRVPIGSLHDVGNSGSPGSTPHPFVRFVLLELRSHMVILACQREDLVGSCPGRTAGGGQPRRMGLVASSAVRERHRGGLDR